MPYNEAAAWVGLTVAGTGFYFFVESLFETDASRRKQAVSLLITVIGGVMVVYAVYAHEYPNDVPQIPTWVLLFPFVWVAIVFEVIERRSIRRVLTDLQNRPQLHPTVDILEENRRAQVAEHKALVASWRKMVREIQLRQSNSHEPTSLLLETHETFLTYLPYRSEYTTKCLYGGTFIVPVPGSTMDGLLHSVLNDIDHWRKTWGID